ncbi:MAG: hypothetical protein COS94_02065 [Candidatus Hydrogenedentes bacterium CG07_land_8_20_14_0_80_42_17]|nr:MAG: hypothetical protein COS94_02065 [Candidatus Hydrogenedentes bacterium CG07_land_8_20_14_0_80_42_17]
MSQWYYNDNGKVVGPCSDDDLRLMHKNKRISDSTYVWKEGMAGWVAFLEAEELALQHEKIKPAPSAPLQSTVSTQNAEPSLQPFAPVNSDISFSLEKDKSSAPGNEILEKAMDLSGLNEMPGEGTCPSCGYYLGSALTCIRCGARSKKYIPLRIIKIITLLGSVFGLIFLLFAARAKQPEDVKIGEIDVMMNGALVRVEGTVSLYEEKPDMNAFKLKVDDGTGEIMVNAYNKLDAFYEFFGEKNMPGLGDKIAVVGSINETEKFGVSLSLNLPERLEILKKFSPTRVQLGNISSKSIGDIMLIRASITSMKSRTLKSGSKLYSLMLDDGTGQLEMTLFDAAMQSLKPDMQKKLLSKQGEFEMLIKIGEYNGNLQANLADPRSLKFFEPGKTVEPELPTETSLEPVVTETTAPAAGSSENEGAEP